MYIGQKAEVCYRRVSRETRAAIYHVSTGYVRLSLFTHPQTFRRDCSMRDETNHTVTNSCLTWTFRRFDSALPGTAVQGLQQQRGLLVYGSYGWFYGHEQSLPNDLLTVFIYAKTHDERHSLALSFSLSQPSARSLACLPSAHRSPIISSAHIKHIEFQPSLGDIKHYPRPRLHWRKEEAFPYYPVKTDLFGFGILDLVWWGCP